jgi:hypothetical protein
MLPHVRGLLYIDGFSCPPDEVSSVLGVQASRTWRAGETIGKSSRVRSSNGWVLESSLENETDPQRHVLWLLERFPETLEALHGIAPQFDAQLSLVIEMDDESPSFNFTASTLARLTRLGVSLDVDLILTAS